MEVCSESNTEIKKCLIFCVCLSMQGALENVKMAGHVLERINASALQIGEVHVVTNLVRMQQTDSSNNLQQSNHL